MSEIEQDHIVQPPHYREGGPQQVVTADTARQGPLGPRVLIILLGSLITAALIVLITAALIVGIMAMVSGFRG